MPTERDIERLKKIAEGNKEQESDPGAAQGSDSDAPESVRDSKLHLSLHVGHASPSSKPPKNKNWAQQAVESPWSKLLAALLVGAGGGEGHRLLSPTGMVEKADLDRHKEEVQRELGREDGKIEKAKEDAVREAIKTCNARIAQDQKTIYALGRYLYYVLPKTGVLVMLPPGSSPPEPPMEFHPPPLVSGITPNGAHPIQPKETFPLIEPTD